MKFFQSDPAQEVIRYKEKGEKFYVIIKGVVSVQIPNPLIKDRQQKYRYYQTLLQWKSEQFDPKVKKTNRKRPGKSRLDLSQKIAVSSVDILNDGLQR